MEGQNQNDELYPIAVLIDELKVTSQGELELTRANINCSMMMSFSDSTLYIGCPQLLLRWVPSERGTN